MCSRPAKTPKLDSDVILDPSPSSLEEKVPADQQDPIPVPTSSKSPQSPSYNSQGSNAESSSEITLVLETAGVSTHINNSIKLQTIINSLDEAMEDEIDRVQKRFYRQKRPYFEERRHVLQNIPFFWRTTLLGHPDLANSMEPLDVQILDYLDSVDILEYSDGDCAYKISFFFSDNPFFSNREFTKEVRMMDSDELVSIGTKIKWKEPYTSLNRRLKVGDKRRPDEPCCEFFYWFSSSNSKYLDKIGEILKEEIWPNPIKYFLPHSGSTDELVVLTDSDSDSDPDQSHTNRTKSDVISIDDDDDEYDVISPGRGSQDTPELINGEVSSPQHESRQELSAHTSTDTLSLSTHTATGSSPLSPVALGETNNREAAPGPPTRAESQALASSEQTHLVLEVQQESEA